MVDIGIKANSKFRSSPSRPGPRTSAQVSAAGPIKKAISDSKASTATDETEIEKDIVENEAEPKTSEETALEKKEKLKKLLKRGLTTKEDKKDDKDAKKNSDKTIDDEWQDKTQAKTEEDKSRYQAAKDKGLEDQLKNDKDSIAKKYPGIERAGAAGGAAAAKSENQVKNGSENGSQNGSQNSAEAFNNGSSGSGVSKLSDGGASANSLRHANHSHHDDSSLGHHHHGRGASVDGPGHVDPGHHGNGAHTAFEALYTGGHIQGHEIQMKSTEDAARLLTRLQDIGVFNKIGLDGDRINFSDFNSSLNHSIHERQRDLLLSEFRNGNINTLSFNGVSESMVSDFTQMLEARVDEIGNDLKISSQCHDGSCQVNLESGQQNKNNQEKQNQESYV